MRTFLITAGAVLVITGCSETGAPGLTSGQFRVLFAVAGALSGEVLEISSWYVRSDQTVVPLGTMEVALEEGNSQTVSADIDITGCLADELREGTGAGCPIRLRLELRDAAGEVVDTSSIGPLNAEPDEVLSPPAVTLRHVESIVLGIVNPTLLIGTTGSVNAQVMDRQSTVVTGRTLTWSSSDASVATVDQSGTVTPVSPGQVTVRAVLHGRTAGPEGTLQLTVISSGSAVIGPAGGTVYSAGGELALAIPPGALTAPTTVTIQPLRSLSRVVRDTGYFILPDGLVLQTPATLTMKYDPQGIPGGQRNEPVLRLLNVGADSLAQDLNAALNTGSHTMTASVLTLSGFYALAIGIVDVKALAVGTNHACAALVTGQGLCWGINTAGAFGDGTVGGKLYAVPVLGGHDFVDVTAGSGFTCGLTRTGQVFCWGANNLGQLGNGTTSAALQPVAVNLTVPAVAVEAGHDHVCAIDQAQTVRCWGGNAVGQLGATSSDTCGSANCSLTPIPLSANATVSRLTAGFQMSCGASSTFLGCWGSNIDSQLGLPSTTAFSATPVPPPAGAPGAFAQLNAGGASACGLLADGSAYCWGFDFEGRIGDGPTVANGPTARAVVGGLQFATLDAGGPNSILTPMCGVTLAGDGYCWGSNGFGQLGTVAGTLPDCGTFGACSPSPVPVSGGLKFREIHTGDTFACGLTTTDQVWCWGRNNAAQLGLGNLSPTPTPTRVQ